MDYGYSRGEINCLQSVAGVRKALKGCLAPALCVGFTLLSSLPALAESEVASDTLAVIETSDSSIYPASFFNQYSPQNALEMIERLPGFSFDEGSDERGFGGNAGNVLIDGSRPTSKSSGLRGALVRIPAEQVVRIEILRGGVSAGEAAGQSIVANVIRSNEGTSGTWALKARKTAHTSAKPNFEAAISTRLGQWDSSFDADIGASPQYRSAVVVNRDAANDISSAADEIFRDRDQWLFINGEGARDLADGKLTLNGRVGGNEWKGDTRRDIFSNQLPDDGQADEFWTLAENNKFRVVELGVDWARTNDEWKLRLIGLGSLEDKTYDFVFHSQDNADSSDFFDSTFIQNRIRTEFVGRGTYGRVSGSAFKPEFGFEVANNELDTDATASEDGVSEVVAGSDVVVAEWRAELFATFVYEFSPALSLEGGLTAEFSQIKVTGAADQKQTFEFIKPRISSTYAFNDDISLNFALEHSVGQLDFNDFAAGSSAADDRTTAGNPGLAPDESTEAIATFDWSFSERGSLQIELFHEWKSDILEQIVISVDDDGFINQGLGNAGDARFWGMEAELNLPLDWIMPNGLIEISYEYGNSTFDDPVTGRDRPINGYTPDMLNFEFRQDLTDHKVAWGIEYWGRFTDTEFLVDEFVTFQGNKRVRFFIETTRYFDIKTQLEVTHLNTGRYTRSRYFFDGSRAGDYQGSQVSSRQRRPELKLSFSGSF